MRTNHRIITTVGAMTVATAMALAVAGCDELLGGDTITGSSQLITETYDFSDFSKVEAGSAFAVEIASEDAHTVAVTVDDNVVENLDVRLDGDTLRIGVKGPDSYRNVTLEAAVAMPALRQLKLTGASTADVASFSSTEPLKIELDGASRVDCSDMVSGEATFDLEGASRIDCSGVEAGEVTVALQGASKLALSGTGGNTDVRAQGASQADLRDFPVANAKVKLEGASKATVNTGGVLDVDLAGSSDLVYLGAPTLGDVDMAGDSKLDPGD